MIKKTIFPINEKDNTHTMFLLHGYSCNSETMEHYIKFFSENLPKKIKMKYILIDAPDRNIYCYKENVPAWYNYYTDHCFKEERINYQHTREMSEQIARLINLEAGKIHNNYRNIYLLGESQGACQAIDTGLSMKPKLGGIMSFRGHLISKTPLIHKQKIWASHGMQDEDIGFCVANESYKKLKKNEYDFQFYKDPELDHYEYSNDEFKSCLAWIKLNFSQSILK